MSAGKIFNEKTSIEKIGNFYIKLIKIEGKWPLKEQVNPQNNLLSEKPKKGNESFENWYGKKNDDKFPHTKGLGFLNETLACIRMICIYFEIPFKKDLYKKGTRRSIKKN